MQRRASSSYGADDRAGRAGVDALAAGAAVLVDRRIDRQRQVGVDLAQEKIRARFAVQQQRVLAAPAEARFLRERDFHHRRAVGERAVAERARPPRRCDRRGAAAAAASPCDSRARARSARRRRASGSASTSLGRARRGRQIIHARRDDAQRAGHQLGRARAPRAVRAPYNPCRRASRARATPRGAASAAERSQSAMPTCWKPSSAPQRLISRASPAKSSSVPASTLTRLA